MKIDNPDNWNHYLYQNIVDRVFLLSLIVLYMVSAPLLDPLGFGVGIVKLICIYCVAFPVALLIALPFIHFIFFFVFEGFNEISCWFHRWIRGY